MRTRAFALLLRAALWCFVVRGPRLACRSALHPTTLKGPSQRQASPGKAPLRVHEGPGGGGGGAAPCPPGNAMLHQPRDLMPGVCSAHGTPAVACSTGSAPLALAVRRCTATVPRLYLEGVGQGEEHAAQQDVPDDSGGWWCGGAGAQGMQGAGRGQGVVA